MRNPIIVLVTQLTAYEMDKVSKHVIDRHPYKGPLPNQLWVAQPCAFTQAYTEGDIEVAGYVLAACDYQIVRDSMGNWTQPQYRNHKIYGETYGN